MKLTSVLLAAVCTLLLLPATSMPAAPRAKASDQAKIAEMVQDPKMAAAALSAMMKDAATKRMMARELAKDQEFRRLYAVEIGTGAPHQERNPSDNPELFQRKKANVR